MSNIKNINIRFNLDKSDARLAWELLQERDRGECKSYSKTIIKALIQYFSETAGNNSVAENDGLEMIVKNAVFEALGEFEVVRNLSSEKVAEKNEEMKPQLADEVVDVLDAVF